MEKSMRRHPSAILAITVVAGLTAAAQPASAATAGVRGVKAVQATAARSATAAVEPRMAAQQPFVAAALRLRQMITAHRYPGFTSISLRDHSVDLRWKGVVPARVRSAIAAE